MPASLVFTEAKRPDRLEEMARDAVAIALNAAKDVIHIDLNIHVDEEIDTATCQAQSIPQQAGYLMRRAGVLDRQAAHLLKSQGISARESNHIMGLSPQWVSQFLAD